MELVLVFIFEVKGARADFTFPFAARSTISTWSPDTPSLSSRKWAMSLIQPGNKTQQQPRTTHSLHKAPQVTDHTADLRYALCCTEVVFCLIPQRWLRESVFHSSLLPCNDAVLQLRWTPPRPTPPWSPLILGFSSRG